MRFLINHCSSIYILVHTTYIIHASYKKLPKHFHLTADNVRDDYSQVLVWMGGWEMNVNYNIKWKTLQKKRRKVINHFLKRYFVAKIRSLVLFTIKKFSLSRRNSISSSILHHDFWEYILI